MSDHQARLRELGEALPRGRFVSRELDLNQERDAACLAAQFGGVEQMQQRYPDLHALFRRTCQTPHTLTNVSETGFQSKAEALTVGYDAASGTAYAMGAVNLTAPAQRLYMALDIYADGKLIAHNTRFSSGRSSGEIEAQSDTMPPLADGKEYTAYLQATWEPEKSNMLRSQIASAQTSAGAAEAVDRIDITHPKHINSAADKPISVVYYRTDVPADYFFPGDRDPKTGNERVRLPMEGTVFLKPGYHVTAVENAGAVLACRGGDILYLASLAYGQDPGTPGVVFFPIGDGSSIGWKLEEKWNNEIPMSTVVGDRTHDLDFSFSFRCKEDQSLHDVLITSRSSDLILAQPHVKSISKMRLYWGCLAKGTKVTLADGTTQNIEALEPGAVLRSPGGSTVTVKKLISGTEDTIYCVHMENGLEVRASLYHPLGTADGFTTPADLDSHSQLMTDRGLSDVLYCYPQEGRIEVYGLELEGGDSFYADGVVSGSNAVMGQLAGQRADQRLTLTPDQAVLDECARLEADFRAGLL